jgi:hypothetical protein
VRRGPDCADQREKTADATRLNAGAPHDRVVLPLSVRRSQAVFARIFSTCTCGSRSSSNVSGCCS